jgi:hypothetical protein
MDHEKWLEQHDEMLADHDREMAEIRQAQQQLVKDVGQVLRRAIRDGIREARNERARRQRASAEIDDRITKLAAAQLITEEKLQRLIERDERRYGGNGGPAKD